MFNTSLLMTGMIFSSIGMGYFIYGKNSNKLTHLLSGIILMILPFFIADLYYLIGISIFLLIIPSFIKYDF